MRNKTEHYKNLKKSAMKTFLTGIVLLSATLSVFAQSNNTPAETGESIFSNAIFLAMIGVIVLLLIIISVLGGVLKNVALYSVNSKNDKKKDFPGVMIFLFLLVYSDASAQTEAVTTTYSTIGGLTASTFNVLLGVILFELLIIAILIKSINTIIRTEQPQKVKEAVPQPSFLEKLNASVAIEKEEEIMFDHEYDGIRELDNDLPPWWKYGFYVTVVFAFIYLIHYHVTKTGDLQLGELKKEFAAAEQQMEEYRKKAANLVDETNVQMLTDAAAIEKGKELFIGNCAACHGKLAEGGVGPNLTDEYWLHGGSIKNIFKTIKYGVAEKGMKSWEADFSPSQISQLASYIKTLAGSNPPNGKEKQGDVYKEEVTESDSLHVVKADSLKTVALADTAKGK